MYDCEVGGKACIEFHVDFLRDDGCVEKFVKLLEVLGPEGGRYSVTKAATSPCKAHHSPDKCKCRHKIFPFGQDRRVLTRG